MENYQTISKAPHLSPEKGGFDAFGRFSLTSRNQTGKAVDSWIEIILSGRVGQFSILFSSYGFLKSSYVYI